MSDIPVLHSSLPSLIYAPILYIYISTRVYICTVSIPSSLGNRDGLVNNDIILWWPHDIIVKHKEEEDDSE